MKFQLVFQKLQLVCTPIPDRCDWSVQTHWSEGANVCKCLVIKFCGIAMKFDDISETSEGPPELFYKRII